MDALQVLKRRWYVLLAGLLLVTGGGVAGAFLVPTNYQASGELLLLLPPQANGAIAINPYLNLDPGLTIAASLIANTASTKEVQRDMEAHGFKSKYSVALNPGTGPLLVISVQDTDPAAAVATRDELIRRLNEDLVRIQVEEHVPERQFIHSRPNSVFPQAEPLPGSKIRALAAIGGVGGTLTLLVAFLMDRRRLPRPKRVADAQTSDSQPSVADETRQPEVDSHPDWGWPDVEDAPPLPPEAESDHGPNSSLSAAGSFRGRL